MRKIIILLLIVSLAKVSFAQNKRKIDSLQTLLKTVKHDTTRVKILIRLTYAYEFNNPDKALDYIKQALSLSEKIGYKKGIGNAYNTMGSIKDDKGDHLSALEFYNKSLKIRQEIGDNQGIAGSYNNIGTIYEKQGNYPEALKYFFNALKINEETRNKKWQAINQVNIGNIYWFQGNNTEALRNYFAALKLDEEIGDKNGIAGSYCNIGSAYASKVNYSEALKNYFAALKIYEKIGNKQDIAFCLNNIGGFYSYLGNYSEALKNYFTALKINEENGNKNEIAVSCNGIGYTYIRQKKYNDAAQYLNKALSLSKELGNLENLKYSFRDLAKLDSAQGNFKQALDHYKLFIATRDSLVNKENSRKIIQTQLQYEFDKKEAVTKAEQDKKDTLAKKELQKQKWVRNAFIGGFAIVLLFALVFFRQRRKIGNEKKKSEDLLLNILPYEVAEELKSTGAAKAKTFSMVSVMFTDFKDFTKISESVSAELLVDEIHYCFSAFDAIIQKYKIEKIKTIGDAYLCASGLPVLNYTHAVDLVNAAIEIRTFMLARQKEKEIKGEIPFELRIGIHTGAVVAGIVGVKKFAYDIWGDTVNIAARMEQNSEAGKINISGSTYQLVKDKFNCVHRGKIEAKNKGEIDMYFVEIV